MRFLQSTDSGLRHVLLLVTACSMCSHFQVYQLAVVNNLYPPATVWLRQHQSLNASLNSAENADNSRIARLAADGKFPKAQLEPSTDSAFVYDDENDNLQKATRSTKKEPVAVAEKKAHQQHLAFLWSSFVAAFPVGKVLGTAVSASLADRYGRRACAMWLSWLLGLAGLTMLAGFHLQSFLLMTIARLWIGVVAGIFLCVTSLLAVECASRTRRGYVVSTTTVFYSAGDFLGVLLSMPQLGIGTTANWGWLMAASCAPALFCIMLLAGYPESPRFLFLTKQDRSAATKAIAFYQGTENVSETIDDLYKEQAAQQNPGSHQQQDWKQLLTQPNTRRALLLAVVLTAGTQISGITIVMTYSTMVLHHFGLSHSAASLATLLLATVKVAGSLPVPWLVERVGRYRCCLLGTAGCALSNLAVMLSAVAMREHAGAVMALFWAVHMAAYNVQAATVGAYTGELLDQTARAKCLVITGCFGWSVAALISEAFPTAVKTGHFVLTMAVLLGLSVGLLYISYRYLPETSTKPLSDIWDEMKTGHPSKAATAVAVTSVNEEQEPESSGEDESLLLMLLEDENSVEIF